MALSNEQWNAPSAGGDFYEHQIANSCRFIGSANDDGTNFMYHTRGTPTNADICTISAWVKRSKLGGKNIMFTGAGGDGPYGWYGFNTANEFWHLQAGDQPRLESNAYFRDPNAWYHIVIAQDTTQGTAANRNKVYINGVQYTDWGDFEDYSTQNADLAINTSGVRLFVGSGGASATNSFYPFDGYIAEYVFIDGLQLTPSSFGETKNGAWVPKDPSGLTFGDNGAYLKFENSAALGNDSSGNDNDFTVTGVAAHDQTTDTPTFNSDSNGGNFATMNPLSNGTTPVFAEGNLMMSSFSGSDISGSLANYALPASSGKWYFECFINAPNNGDNYPFIGLTATIYAQSAAGGVDQRDLSINLGTGGSEKGTTHVGTITTDFTSVGAYADNTVCGVFVDMDARKLWYAKDGAFTNSGNPQDGTNPNYVWTNNVPLIPHFVSYSGFGAGSIFNFGQEGTFAGNISAGSNADVTGYGNFKYDPGDYKALCSGNLPIDENIDPEEGKTLNEFFDTVLYTGDGGTNTSITSLNFQPDWLLIKNRDVADGWLNQNSVSGVGVTHEWNDDGPYESETDCIKSFNSNGWTMSNDHKVNANTEKYVAYGWKKSADAGFDIVEYSGTGSTNAVSHSLGAAPDCVMMHLKSGSDVDGTMYFNSLTMGTGKGVFMTLANAAQATQYMAATSSSTFTPDNSMNSDGRTYVAYVFRSIEGFSKFGEFEGNANANGTFIYTGFRPKFVFVKAIDASENWQIRDTARAPYNIGTVGRIYWNTNGAEQSASTASPIDFLANGFKTRGSNTEINAATCIYGAWGDVPYRYGGTL